MIPYSFHGDLIQNNLLKLEQIVATEYLVTNLLLRLFQEEIKISETEIKYDVGSMNKVCGLENRTQLC